MTVYLLRHGLAVQRGSARHQKDRDRPLTAEGGRKIRRIAKAMRELQLSFDLILSSPWLRARQTAEIVAETFEVRKSLELFDPLAPGGDAGQLIHHLKQLPSAPGNVLLVGHEPYLSDFVGWIATGKQEPFMTFKKGGLCKLVVTAWTARRGATLEWLLTPRQMLLMV
jgi:phosphohistidine phosphatase